MLKSFGTSLVYVNFYWNGMYSNPYWQGLIFINETVLQFHF